MIMIRTPLRISFAGGGTDLPAFYLNEPGGVTSTTINKYIYVAVHPFFNNQIYLKYNQIELVSNVGELKMPAVKAALKLFDIDGKLEIVVVSDLPPGGGSGLGGSTALSVGLLHALSVYKNRSVTKMSLAQEATRLEMEILKNPIGKQDQYASSCGGFNFIRFNPDETVQVEPLDVQAEARKMLEGRLLMFFSGRTRAANNILSDQQAALNDKNDYHLYRQMFQYAVMIKNSLLQGDISDFGRILHENWLIKKTLSRHISDSTIDEIYALALKAGAEGGKLLGAGGGGFFLFYCKEEHQAGLREKMKGLPEYRFKFESKGTTIILNEDIP